VFAELHAKDGPTQGIHRSATPFFPLCIADDGYP